ncbi:MAG: helix-turn-helix transcriptional regulator [Sphingomonadales bacterium]
MINTKTHPLDSSQTGTRETVRIMMHVTRWSASKLAVKSGLAASTLNRFMHKDVKHTLKFSTLTRLLITTLARLNERLRTEQVVSQADIEAVIPLIGQFGIDLEKEADELARSADPDSFWRLDEISKAVSALTGTPGNQPSTSRETGRSEPPPIAGCSFSDVKDLPVLGAAKGGNNSLFFDNGTVHEHIHRPPGLGGVENAFAVYMVGDSMEPRYFAGEYLYVNPNRPPARNCFVVVELVDGQGLVKQFVRRDDATLHLRQFNPEKLLQFDNDQVKSVYYIVGASEP